MFERQDKLKPLIEDEYNVTYTLFRKKKNFLFRTTFKNNSREKSLIKKHNVKIKRNNISWDLRKSIQNMLAYVIHFSSV